MIKAKRVLYAVAVFIVLLIIIQVFVNAFVSTMISDYHLKSLIALLLSVGLSFYFTRSFLNKNNRRKL
ncbi:hypothetical protein [Paenibacillus taiwanensis]|uniref:hypothetical protein n=1 Tax=Paenibacillus taiwanensis TaxID=401638 RepID=UPI000411D866|nr:hypothetical protein [Paenibacillus taiwanensis]